ncbi:MAG: hypothetical protein H0T79_12245, partial [Deltaproteobacteria bacterium]|nr:hypothetical protein [Deltaproteobacteria bacterium]
MFAPPPAHAEATLPTVIWNKTLRAKKPAPAGFTSISHVIYLNNCLPNGCALAPGSDDSRAVPDRSSIASGNVMLDAWPHGDAAWQELVQCVRETYAPFDIQIVTEDPGSAPHSE